MSDFDLKNVAAQFCVGEYVSCERYGEGHINDTYKLTVREGGREKPYILQRINNRLFTDVPALMRNIELVTDFCRRSVEARGGDPMRECLNLVRTRDGKNCYTDGENWFRVYVFIENATTYQIVRDPRDFYESAVAFGSFANLLAGFDASQLTEVLPDFHNTRVRYANFLRSVEKDACGRRREVEKEIAWVNAHKELCGAIVDKIASGEIPLRVTHNDTKLNNVLIDVDTKKSVCVIDLDTVMAGSMLYDFGDGVRVGCSTAAEDEKDLGKVHFDINMYRAFERGFLKGMGNTVTPKEKSLMSAAARLMTFECGMRFLTDYLSGDVYFKTKYAEHNLVRARTQFKLVEEMEKAFPELEKSDYCFRNAEKENI